MAVTDWSSTASENTSVGGVSIAEGCPAKGLNNAIREVMAAVKARDGEVVHTSGAETVGGVKTFSDGIEGDLVGDVTGDLTGDVTGNVTGNLTGNVTGDVTGDLAGNADTATSAAACTGNSATASKLQTARSLKTKLDSTAGVTFDGSADQNAIPVTGTLPVGNGGTGGTSLDGAGIVTKSGNQSIAGVKTLTGLLNANGGIKINGLEVVAVENNAGAHNGIYRGKDLTSVYTLAQLHTKLSAGDFSDLYIGDYITKPVAISYSGTLDGETITASFNANMNFRFAHFDYWYGMGDTALNTHHIVLVPDKSFFNVKMRRTNTTEGGIPSSNVWTLLQGTIYNALNAASCMNGRILAHRDWIPDSVNVNAPSAAGANFMGSTVWTSTMWRDVKLGMLHEPMVYGGAHFSSSGYDTGCGAAQLALFQLEPAWIHCGSNRNNYWLCAVSSASHFAGANGYGLAYIYYASYAGIGVRPFFLIG